VWLFPSRLICPSVPCSVPIVPYRWEHFNDRNLVLLNSVAWTHLNAKTFLKLVDFPSWLLCSPCVSSFFTPFPSSSFLSPPWGYRQRERERERTRRGGRRVPPNELLWFLFARAISDGVLNAERMAIYSVIQSGRHCATYCISQPCFPLWMSHTTSQHLITTVGATTHSLIKYLISLLRVMSPFVSNRAMVEFGTAQRWQRSQLQAFSPDFLNLQQMAVWLRTGQLVRNCCGL